MGWGWAGLPEPPPPPPPLPSSQRLSSVTDPGDTHTQTYQNGKKGVRREGGRRWHTLTWGGACLECAPSHFQRSTVPASLCNTHTHVHTHFDTLQL